jgi:hypothetical protein
MNKNDVLLSEYVKLYELALSYEGKTPATLSIYMSNLRRFCRHLEAQLQHPPALSDFTPDAVMEYVVAMKTGPKYAGHPYKTIYSCTSGVRSDGCHPRTGSTNGQVEYQADHSNEGR